MSGNEPGTTREIARFASRLLFKDLPQTVVEKAKETILDQIGAEIACAGLPTSQIVFEYAKRAKAHGNSTILGYGLKTNPEMAALCNGTFGHGFEIDDYHLPALSHPGCVAVPAAFAIGEEIHAPGKDVIVGVTLACEIIVRIGLAAGASMVMERGFHETCIQGTLGAAVGTGRMMGLTEAQLLNALGIAGSHSSGTLEYGQTGGEVKRLHGGLGAAGGVRSAMLAQIGLTAPPTILEGRKGLLQAVANTYDVKKLTDGLGEDYQMLGISVKPYCCCGPIQPQIDAVASLVSQYGLAPEQIEEIILGATKLGFSHCGTRGPEPKDINDAQLSTHFSIGLTVVKHSNDFKAYYDSMKVDFKEQAVLDVARKVKVYVDDVCERNFPEKNMCKAVIKTIDGRELTAVVDAPKGDKKNPVTREQLVDKFMGLATVAISRQKAIEIKDLTLDLENLADIGKLTERLVS